MYSENIYLIYIKIMLNFDFEGGYKKIPLNQSIEKKD